MPIQDPSHQKHTEKIDEIALARGWRTVQDTTIQLLDGSCLYQLAYESRHYENHIIGDGWEYLEVGFKTSKRGRRIRSRSEMVHYAVISMKLPRKLPNVVFDSLKHERRQFKLQFDPKQCIQLEGNFDAYFATYFGNDYAIDSLSFITPEVMEALISAGDYDIEIVHDRLLLFGAIKPDAAAQIEEMIAAIHLVRKKLLNNILTYRDERVPYDEGRKVVARAGMFLDRRPYSGTRFQLHLLFIFILIVLAAFSVAFAVIIIGNIVSAN